MAGFGAIGSAILSVKILVDAGKAAQDLGDAAGKVEKFQGQIGKAVGPAALVGGALVAFGKSAMTAASDAEQAMGGVDSVFGKSADQVKAWSDQAAQSVGLSKKDYGQFATVIGAGFKTAGLPMDQVAKKTDDMIKLGADLAATYGGTTAQAVESLSAAMRGEYDSTEKYAVGLSAATVAAEMHKNGTDKLKGAALTAAKATTTLQLAQKNAAGAVGQFARESDGAAGSAQIAAASFENTKAKLGDVLLPVAAKAAEIFATMSGFVGQNARLFQVLAGVVGGLAAGILLVAGALKVYQAVQTAWAAATKVAAAGQWLLNAAMSANPVALVVIGIVALIAAIVLLWTKCAAFRNFFIGVWQAIQTAAAVAWQAIVTAFNAAITAIKVSFAAIITAGNAVWSAIKTAVAAVGVAVKAVWRAIQIAAAAAWTGIKVAVAAVGAAVVAVWRGVQTAAAAVWRAITGAVKASAAAIGAVMRALGTAAAAVWNGIKTAAATVWAAIKTVIHGYVAAINLLIKGLQIAAAAVWAAIKASAALMWSGIKATVKGVVDALKQYFLTLVTVVSGVWQKIADAAKAALNPIKTVIDGIKEAWQSTFGLISSGVEKVAGWIGNLFNKIRNPPAVNVPKAAGSAVVGGYAIAATGPGLSSRAVAGRSATVPAGSGGPSIVINGALDPDAVARQIRAILTGRDRRTAGVRIGGMAMA